MLVEGTQVCASRYVLGTQVCASRGNTGMC